MVPATSPLVARVLPVDQLPLQPAPARRGRPAVYPERLFLKAPVSMRVQPPPEVRTLRAVPDRDTPAMRRLRGLLTAQARHPGRRTRERRPKARPDRRPARVGRLGRHPLGLPDPWRGGGRPAAIDSSALRALGGVWHRKDRAAGLVPHSSIDTEAHWTRSGRHGRASGWPVHPVATVAAVWIPPAAELPPAHVAGNEAAPPRLEEPPGLVRCLPGDTGYHAAALHARCAADGRLLVTPTRGPYPHTAGGLEVRRGFHQLRSRAIENVNGRFGGRFECLGQGPTGGPVATRRSIPGAVFVSPSALPQRFQTGGDLRVGLKAFLRAAGPLLTRSRLGARRWMSPRVAAPAQPSVGLSGYTAMNTATLTARGARRRPSPR
jgi:hypothetical protein